MIETDGALMIRDLIEKSRNLKSLMSVTLSFFRFFFFF